THPGERGPERRIDHFSHQPPSEEQHEKAIEISGLAEDIEPEQAKNGRHDDAGKTVRATGERGCLVGDLQKNGGDREREHEEREGLCPEDDRSEERRVGKECRAGCGRGEEKEKVWIVRGRVIWRTDR